MIWLPGWLTSFHSDYCDIAKRGAYGDTYGPVNALFTGLAFVVLIGTIVAQMIELGLQRKELRDTREELRGQREQLEAQSETLQLQRFENTFFELQRVHIDIVSGIEFQRHIIEVATSLQRILVQRFGHKFGIGGPELLSNLSQAQQDSGSSKADFVQELLDKALAGDLKVKRCMRQLFHLIGFVDETEVANRERYVSFIEAQLNPEAIVAILYSGLTAYGEEYKSLIEKYGLLESLPERPSSDFEGWCREGLYAQGAFGERE